MKQIITLRPEQGNLNPVGLKSEIKLYFEM